MESRPSDDERGAESKLALEDYLETLQDPVICDDLAKRCHKEFQKTLDLELLDKAILCARKAAETCSADDPRLPRYYSRIAAYLGSRHRRSDSPRNQDLDDALRYLDPASKSAQLGSESAREKAKRLHTAADCHQGLFQAGRDDEYDRAADAYRKAAEAWEAVGEADKVGATLHDLGLLHAVKFERDKNKDLGLLDRSIDCIEEAIQSIDETNECWSGYLCDKIEFLERRAAHDKDRREKDYLRAIETCRLLIRDSEDDFDGSRANLQGMLGGLYLRLGKVTNSMDDFHEATYNLQRASEATARDHPDWKSRFDVFQEALEEFRAMLGQPRGLNRTIIAQEKIVASILQSSREEDQGEQQADALHKLALLQQLRYVQRRTIEDLISMADNLRKAAAKTPETSYEKLLERLGLAADCYEILYREEADLKYLRLGIETGRVAVDAAKNAQNISSRKAAAAYSTLGRCFAALSEEEEDPELMIRAIEAGGSAVELIGREDQSDDDDACKRERRKYIVDLQSWEESVEYISGSE